MTDLHPPPARRRPRVPGRGRSWWVAAAALAAAVVLWPDSAPDDAAAAGSSHTIVDRVARTAAGPTPVRPTPAAASPSAPAVTTQVSPPTQATTAPQPATRPTSVAAPAPTTGARPGSAVQALATIPVKGRAPKSGYERELFGQAWKDVDRNGCDTRNDILRRDLTAYVLKAGTNGCLVLRGTLHDPYTGRTISFLRGPGTSSAVQVDHVVALSDAWQKGAQQMSFQARTALANDPLNLLAVDGPTNLRKGDGDAATWLPPRKAYRCRYVARQVAVKHRYGLWVTAAERDAMARVLESCPGQVLPTAGAVRLGGGTTAAATATPAPVQGAGTPVVSPKAAGTDPRFATCKAAVAAGFGPYVSGRDAEYGWYRDGDHDGVVCE